MEITDVKVRKIQDAGKLLAVASITISEEFAIHDIKLIQGKWGLFMAMPSVKMSGGDYKDIVHPLRKSTREQIENMILEKYQEGL